MMNNKPFVPLNCFFKGSYNPEYEELIKTVKIKCHKYNQLCPSDVEGYNEILRDLIGKLGKDAIFVPHFVGFAVHIEQLKTSCQEENTKKS